MMCVLKFFIGLESLPISGQELSIPIPSIPKQLSGADGDTEDSKTVSLSFFFFTFLGIVGLIQAVLRVALVWFGLVAL